MRLVLLELWLGYAFSFGGTPTVAGDARARAPDLASDANPDSFHEDGAQVVEADTSSPSAREESAGTEGLATPLAIRKLQGDGDSFQTDLDDLNERISTFSKVQATNFTDWLSECAYYFKRGGFGSSSLQVKYSTYNMKNKPSGLCLLTLYVSFKGAVWNDAIQDVLGDADLLNTRFEDIESKLPTMALPAFMSFPESAKDIVEIVRFANTQGKKVSIKNSGHSYTASSSSEGSIQINLRKFPQYSFTDIYECKETKIYTPLSGSDGACKLALGRGKTAMARVGGGQGNDDMFRSVMNFNFNEPREKRYNALGGAEGMIGGGGGFMMGGGLGRGEERLYGSGADQVLELEMVLPDGKHVKFGPTEWEEKDGFVYPQTTKVEGKCNDNIDHDESKWEWIDCPNGQPFTNATFEDLWFAVRGGGGGAWGIVLSSFQQLHELIPQFSLGVAVVDPADDILIQTCVKLENCEALPRMLNSMWLDFLIDLLWNTDNDIGVDKELSRRCGFTSQPFKSPILPGAGNSLKCHGHGIQEKFQNAWKASVSKSKYILDGFGDDVICAIQTRVYLEGGHYDKWHRDKMAYPVLDPSFFFNPIGHYGEFSGPEGAYRNPVLTSWPGAMIPADLLAAKSQEILELLLIFSDFNMAAHTLPYASENDGINPLPEVYHSGGIQTYLGPFKLVLSGTIDMEDPCSFLRGPSDDAASIIESAEKELGTYQALILSHLGYEPNSDFPGFTEYNHVFATSGGVLKSDPTKTCPFMSTREEKKQICLSVQETVWGTKNFNRLTNIKNVIDPENLFDVHFGVGNDERAGPWTDYCAKNVVATAPPIPDPEYSAPSQLPQECAKSAKPPTQSGIVEPTASPQEGEATVSPTASPSAPPTIPSGSNGGKSLVGAWTFAAIVVIALLN